MSRRNLVIGLVLIVAALSVAGLLRPPGEDITKDTPGLPQSQAGNEGFVEGEEIGSLNRRTQSVDVNVVFLNLLQDVDSDILLFEIALDTHSVSLSSYPIEERVIIRTDEGFTLEEGFTWQPQSDSDHHVNGYLQVPNLLSSGDSIVGDGTRSVSLELLDLDGVSALAFDWTLPENGLTGGSAQ